MAETENMHETKAFAHVTDGTLRLLPCAQVTRGADWADEGDTVDPEGLTDRLI